MNSHPLKPYRGFEIVWHRWGLGVELSLGHWVPREWSVTVILGPLLMWWGYEEDYDAS